MAKKIKKSKKPTKQKLYIDIGFFSPGQIKKKIEEYRSPYMAQQIYAAYITAIAATAAVSYIYSFEPLFMIITGVIFFLTAPIILLSIHKCNYETKKFMDINSYMKQFTHSMRRSEKISSALIDTYEVFKDGEMKQTIKKAIDHMNSSWDVKISKVEALGYIEEVYGNNQLVMLHDFCLRAEEHGGDFKKELDLLEDMRDKWQKRNNTRQVKLMSATYTTIIVNIIFVALTAYIVQGFPESISIKEIVLVQIAEVFYIASFCAVLIMLQNKRCSSILNDNRQMSLEEAEEAMDYIKNFDKKKSGEKFRPLGIFVIVLSAVLALTIKSIPTIIYGLIGGGVTLNLHHIIYIATKNQLRKEMENEFPKWLFDLCLLMQKDTVLNAISKSLYTAPPVLRRDIRALEEKLYEDPTNEIAFLDFLEEYDMTEVLDTMRSLINMKKGSTISNQAQMQQLISYNLKLLDEREEAKYESLNAKAKLFMFVPFIFTIVLIVVYFLVMFLLIFDFAASLLA